MDGWMVRCAVLSSRSAVQFTGERDDINVKSVFYFQFDIIFGFQTEYRHQTKREDRDGRPSDGSEPK